MYVTMKQYIVVFEDVAMATGNGSFRSYSRSDPGSFGPIPFRSGRFGMGRFGPISRVGRFGPILAGRFGPLYFI